MEGRLKYQTSDIWYQYLIDLRKIRPHGHRNDETLIDYNFTPNGMNRIISFIGVIKCHKITHRMVIAGSPRGRKTGESPHRSNFRRIDVDIDVESMWDTRPFSSYTRDTWPTYLYTVRDTRVYIIWITMCQCAKGTTHCIALPSRILLRKGIDCGKN